MKIHGLIVACLFTLMYVALVGIPQPVHADMLFPAQQNYQSETSCEKINDFCIEDSITSLKESPAKFLVAYAANLIVEVSVATIILLFLNKFTRRIALSFAAVNIISLPLFYALLHANPTINAYVFGELSVLLFEIAGVYALSRNQLSFLLTSIITTTANLATIALSFLLLS